jgi:magnesium transporter
MQRDLVTARAHTKQGKIAALAIEHNIKEVPIVDAAGTLLGVVPHDVILSILREEHINETLRSAGVTSFDDSIKTMSGARATTLIKKRLPWLFIGLVGSSLAALIIQFFQGTLEEQILLASFIPAVMYISGAVSVQSETLLIRTELVDTRFSFSRYLTRELAVGGGLAVTLSLAMGGLSFLIWQSTIVSAVLALSFFVAIIIASMVAISLPWASSKLNIDPALSGGPLDTILSDIISITVYFAIANLLIRTLT